MSGLCHVLLVYCTTAFATQAIERFEVPHWISLLPDQLEKQIKELQDSNNQQADQACQKLREEHWDLQIKASELAEKGKAGPDYVAAADQAEAAAQREQECRKAHPGGTPLVYSFDLHAAPETTSEKLGQLVVEVRPWIYDGDENNESQVKTVFIDSEKKSSTFTADVPHPFNEKPSVFHTVMARKGKWYQLPPKPFPKPAWVNFSGLSMGAPLSILKISRPVFVKTGDIGTYVVFSEKKGRKLIGIESMENRGKKVSKTKPVEVNVSELFDINGHIRAKWRADDED